MAKGWGHFAIGLAGGVAGGLRQKKIDQEREEDRAEVRADRAERREDRERVRQERISLADAARPTTIEEGAGGAIRPATMDNRDVGLPENADLPNQGLSLASFRTAGKEFTDRAGAEQAQATFNSPEATIGRVAQAQMATDPGKAITLQNAALSHKQAAAKQATEQANLAWRSKLGTAMQAGHDGLAELVTSSEAGPLAGQKVKAVPSADGKTVVYNAVGADGALTPLPQYTFPNNTDGVTQAGFLLDRSITPQQRYEASLKERELTRKVGDSDAKHANQVALLDLKGKQVELQGDVAAARIAAASAKNGQGPNREERLRYTSLHAESGRRMSEAQKALGTLQKDILFMNAASKPGTPQAQELADLRGSLAAYKEERDLYGSLLAGSQGKEKPAALSDAKPSTPAAAPAAAAPVKVATKADRDKLAKGTRYVGPDGQTYVKQ